MGWNNTSKPLRIGDEWVTNRRRMGIVENRWRMGRESATAGAEITLQSIADEGKASSVRTRQSVASDLETKSGLIGDGEWLIGNSSSATVRQRIISNGDDSSVTVNGLSAMVQCFRYFFFVWVSLFLIE